MTTLPKVGRHHHRDHEQPCAKLTREKPSLAVINRQKVCSDLLSDHDSLARSLDGGTCITALRSAVRSFALRNIRRSRQAGSAWA